MEKIHENIPIRIRKNTNFLVYIRSIFVLFSILILFGVLPVAAQGASFIFSPSAGSYQVGQNFSVAIKVSSSDQAINAASGVISFPIDRLEVVSISKANSKINFWVQEPSFSNTIGSVNFEGVILNPGFQGQSGEVIIINFKVKGIGVSVVSFSSGSILANDGLGTNIIYGLGQATFSLGSSSGQTTTGITATAPTITSSTHPDSSKWYNIFDVKFNWEIPKGITAIRILYDKYPYSVPTVVYKPAISGKEIEGIKDGVWYFHAQFKDEKGWGAISHFRFRIDTVHPNPFSIKFISGTEIYNPQPQVLFNTADELSGINYYKIKIGDGDFFEQQSDIFAKDNPYVLPKQLPGKRTLIVQAFDVAGNSFSAVQEFEIKALDAPIITEYPKNLDLGENLIIKGKTYSNSQVRIWLQRGDESPKSETISVNGDGLFVYTHANDLKSGNYKFWVRVMDVSGASSLDSDFKEFTVGQPTLIRLGSVALSYLGVLVPLVVLVFVLAFVVFFGWHKYTSFRKRLRKEIKEAEEIAEEDMELLKSHICKQIEYLQKIKEERKLTKEEEKTVESMKRSLEFFEKRSKKTIKRN